MANKQTNPGTVDTKKAFEIFKANMRKKWR